jgi:hypothetical protein
MTGRQAIIQLKAKLNNLDTASNRTLRPELALLFLNDAYSKLVDAKYSKGNKEDSTSFQLDQSTTDDLNHLTINEELVPTKVGDEYIIQIADLPNYSHHLRSVLEVVFGGKTYKVNKLNYKTLDTIGTVFEDPFNSTEPLHPVTYFENNQIIVLTDGFSVTKHKVTYLREPKTITLDEQIEAPFVGDIIDHAAVMVLENWGDQRTQSKLTIDKVIDAE